MHISAILGTGVALYSQYKYTTQSQYTPAWPGIYSMCGVVLSLVVTQGSELYKLPTSPQWR